MNMSDQVKLETNAEEKTHRRDWQEHAHPSRPLLLCLVPPSRRPIVCQGHAGILSAIIRIKRQSTKRIESPGKQIRTVLPRI